MAHPLVRRVIPRLIRVSSAIRLIRSYRVIWAIRITRVVRVGNGAMEVTLGRKP